MVKITIKLEFVTPTVKDKSFYFSSKAILIVIRKKILIRIPCNDDTDLIMRI